MHLRQRTHLDRIVDDEGRLYKRSFTEFAKDFVDEFTLTHGVVDLHLQLLADRADLLLALTLQVVTGLLLDGLQNRQTTVGSLEVDLLAIYLNHGCSVHGQTDLLEQLFGEAHHPVVVLVLHIELHTGKLRIVGTVHTFVTEVLADLIDTFETADNQTLQIELRSNTEIEINIQ